MDCDYTSICGNKPYNEDRMIVNGNMAIVIDGSGYCSNKLNVADLLYDLFPSFILERLSKEETLDTKEVSNVISTACLDLDRLIQRNYNAVGSATLSGIIKVDNEVFVVNVGNCNTILFNGIVPVYLTDPHTMKNKKERERISNTLFSYHGKAEGLFYTTRCFGNYHHRKGSVNGPYDALATVDHIISRITHAFIYTSGLKVELNNLIFTALNTKDKISTNIINEAMNESNTSLIVVKL